MRIKSCDIVAVLDVTKDNAGVATVAKFFSDEGCVLIRGHGGIRSLVVLDGKKGRWAYLLPASTARIARQLNNEGYIFI